MTSLIVKDGFHELALAEVLNAAFVHSWKDETRFTYTFRNHFHPYVGRLIEKLNRDSIDGVLDVDFHASLVEDFFVAAYSPNVADDRFDLTDVEFGPTNIDVSERGPYSVYNWELLFHLPFSIAVHLSKNQRFAEAQKWFHYIFDPTCDDITEPVPQRFWKFLRFRERTPVLQIDDLLLILSKPTAECTPEELELKELVISGYEEIRDNPFQPHVVARTRVVAYQLAVVMKYLDNLIAWGDSLFRQDTIESINEAMQVYVLASSILGPRPQRVPAQGTVKPKTYAQLKAAGLDPFSNALVELEGQFPFNVAAPSTMVNGEETESLFGIARTLYFCLPKNDKLLAYWDLVADRLYKIRNCMNIEGVVRQLALFDPPLDPGMLVKAAAAGIDISSLVAGMHQPGSPMRATLVMQKALEITAEVRSLGSSLLSALEKRDGERLSLLRQEHELVIQRMNQDLRFIQWKEAEEATQVLLRTRAAVYERYRHYMLLLGKAEGDVSPFESLSIDRGEITEETFDDAYRELVATYAGEVMTEPDGPYTLADENNPLAQSGASGVGRLNLLPNEDADLNLHGPAARRHTDAALDKDQLYGVLGLLPNIGADFHFWGLGGHIEFGGPMLSAVGRILAGADRGRADRAAHEGARALKVAGYERRTIDVTLQANSAARELMTNGRQVLAALLREQATRREWETIKQQIANAERQEEFLREKFTNVDLYAWMQGELSKLYYDCYRFAFDVARKAELTMKRELMRPELDELDFVRFNYWDGGRKGLLSGESLYLDLKRMELAYHDFNRRELELTKHVSLQQLDPLALLQLRTTGSCEVALPEWVFDLETPGHYLRRIKTVGVSIPAVTGPYTSVHCTLTLLRSSIRRQPLLQEGEYRRAVDGEDARFVDYTGAIQQVVTSTATNDSGLFETNLRDERYLPFEGHGAVSVWRLSLPMPYRSFDYGSISDVVLHVRYTARDAGGPLREGAVASVAAALAADEDGAQPVLTRLFTLRHDFPAEWHAFAVGSEDFEATVGWRHFPYVAQSREIAIAEVELLAVDDGGALTSAAVAGVSVNDLTDALAAAGEFVLFVPDDGAVMVRDPSRRVFLRVAYTLT
ncbi:MAG: toxin [Gaiella sp.]